MLSQEFFKNFTGNGWGKNPFPSRFPLSPEPAFRGRRDPVRPFAETLLHHVNPPHFPNRSLSRRLRKTAPSRHCGRSSPASHPPCRHRPRRPRI